MASDSEAISNSTRVQGDNIQFFAAAEKTAAPVVVFVPNFGGTIQSMRRHIRFVNELGFDAVGVNLKYNEQKVFHFLPIASDLQFGLRHIWAEEIESALNAIAGLKIIYSFSFPSCAALEAIDRRFAADVIAWICDGGPFLHAIRCTWNLYRKEIRNPLMRTVVTAASGVYLGYNQYKTDLHAYFQRLPPQFPILSVRGWQDELVPVNAIDDCFVGHDHLRLETLGLPEGKHLDGLLRHPEEYKPRIKEFLEQRARLRPRKLQFDRSAP